MATLKERLALAAVLLEEARKEFERRTREYDELFREAVQGRRKRLSKNHDANGGAGTTAAAGAGPDAATGGADREAAQRRVQEVILAALQQAAPNAKLHRDIADEGGLDAETVRITLIRMKKAGKVDKAGRGLWKLKDAQASA